MIQVEDIVVRTIQVEVIKVIEVREGVVETTLEEEETITKIIIINIKIIAQIKMKVEKTKEMATFMLT